MAGREVENPEPGAGSVPGEVERVVPMRLQKFLARAGVASRRGSEDLMTAGRVRVNGEVTTSLGSKVDPLRDVVEVDGHRVELAVGPVYLALNKPAGCVTTMSDPQGRPTVAELVPVAEYPGLFPVGRLDLETTGVLLFTTDGEMSHRLLHPRWKVPKTYVALVDGHVAEDAIARLRSGVELDDGRTAPADVVVLERRETATLVQITLREGRKRQVRRMFSAVGHPVSELNRTVFGPVAQDGIEPGRWRMLDDDEVRQLREVVGLGV